MEKWWKNKGKVSGPWKNKALFLPFSRIWKQRSFFLCSSTVFPWKNRNPVAVTIYVVAHTTVLWAMVLANIPK